MTSRILDALPTEARNRHLLSAYLVCSKESQNRPDEPTYYNSKQSMVRPSNTAKSRNVPLAQFDDRQVGALVARGFRVNSSRVKILPR